MTTTNQNHQKFQRLLRELFQFDCADLDFGIYRIMNHKRKVIEKFISEDLIKAVSEELDRGILHDQDMAVIELQETAKLVRETFGSDALDAAGKLLLYHETPLGKKYLKWQQRTIGARSRASLEADIFNHLFAFFSRYYQDGDFISKRRYSGQQRYAIPYNGEEVYLHWANSDQYYIKTAERFHDYSFISAHGVTVHFKLRAADIEQNNVKGERRFFLPCVEAVDADEAGGELTIPFEYRPLTGQEESDYDKSDQQAAIIAEAVTTLPTLPGLPDDMRLALTAEHHHNADGEPVTLLEHHLRQYTRRNTSDFFIHKDLKGFLTCELDFYLKSEALNLNDMEIAGEDLAEGWFQIIRTISTMGARIIDFLAQVEGFQKLLWEKRKFVTDTQYCITIGNIDERFYPAIAACEPQWEEWKALFHIDENKPDLFNSNGNKRIVFMQDHPTLVLDTRHFNDAFKDDLLASIEDIDEFCDGLLVHSENFQALGFLQDGYREQVKCIYIDPPYNTDASAILYKNDYKDSSWLSLMENRLALSKNLLSKDGILCCAIDDEEMALLRQVMQPIFEKELGIVPVRSNPAGRKSSGQFSPAHEYALFYGNADAIPGTLPKTENELARFPLQDNRGRFAWANLVRSGSNDRREDRPKMFYPIYVTKNDTLRIPEMEWDEDKREYKILEQSREDETVAWPIKVQNGTRVEKNWHRGWELVKSDLSEYRIRRDEKGSVSIDFKTRMDTDSMPRTWWDDKKYASANLGPKTLKDLFSNKDFDFAKAIDLVGDCLRASLCEARSVVLDYFAGSGTTGHAVINLNREDGGKRRFILVEMGQYFNTVLLPRIKKVTFTPEWKDGRPERMATQEEAERSPRIIKRLRLESYEDALGNIGFDDSSGQQAMRFDDYMLKYMLTAETRRSATFLNVEQLARPFDYKLNIHSSGETRETIVDIPETFNYLLGLHVQTRRNYYDEGRRYLILRGVMQQRQVVILWRETEGWQKAEMERDKQFVTEQELTEGADEVYVNGDSFIPKARSLDPVFKDRMFAPMSA